MERVERPARAFDALERLGHRPRRRDERVTRARWPGVPSSIDSTDRSYPQWELSARPRLVDEVRAFSMITGYECGMAVARGELPLTWSSECGPGSPRRAAMTIHGFGPVEPSLDHLVYAVPDLDAATRAFAAATGVVPAEGGARVGRGTRNVLVGFGETSYLEIIGPDPDHPPAPAPRCPSASTR